jgi:hypothetical protein
MTNIFNKLFPEVLYHSYVIEGDPLNDGENILDLLVSRKETEKNSNDLYFKKYEALNIEDSRDIKSWHSQSGIGKSKKICIICAKFINHEAEQALLKIIEEPGENTHFFIIVSDSSILLPTILSRVHLIKIKNESNIDIKKEVIDFIKSSKKERIDKVAIFIKENKDEDNSGALRYFATSFVNELEVIFYKEFKKDINNKDTQFILEELQKVRGYLSTKGAGVKMILEHLALVI